MKVAAERIIAAQGSSNLAEREEGLGDIDIVRALGLVAAASPLGVSLWRLRYQHDVREWPRVQQGLRDEAVRRAWAADALAAHELVTSVLMHWLDDVCPDCHGRGYMVMPGAPVLSDEACPTCKGQGKIAMKNATDGAVALLEYIARLEREVAGAVMRRLADEMP